MNAWIEQDGVLSSTVKALVVPDNKDFGNLQYTAKFFTEGLDRHNYDPFVSVLLNLLKMKNTLSALATVYLVCWLDLEEIWAANIPGFCYEVSVCIDGCSNAVMLVGMVTVYDILLFSQCALHVVI